MKKNSLKIILLLLLHFSLNAQRKITPTDFFIITGKITNEHRISVQTLDSFPKQRIKDLVIFNQKGEAKDTLQQLKGVLFKDILSKIIFTNDKPKDLNEFYFVCTASDNYKVVFSWNEIYNTEVGNNLYFITELEGKSIINLDQRIIVVATSDLKSGRRFIKALQKIEVKQAQ